MRRLLDLAWERGLTVEWDPRLGDYLRGLYDHASRTIILNSRLPVRALRCTLAHELGHAWYGHRWTGDPHADQRAEELADEHGTQLLIAPAEYARAERLVGPEAGALALELDVTVWMVRAWQSAARRGRSWTGTGPIPIVRPNLIEECA
jgi:Zn-dependent peptidase ImmA (M78 family)